MSDSYQAIYGAVLSRISNGDIGGAIRDVAHQAFDISHLRMMVHQDLLSAINEYSRPSAVYRPKIFIDGNQWCALYGDNTLDGVAGFGDTPDKAMWDFDANWRKSLPAKEPQP